MSLPKAESLEAITLIDFLAFKNLYFIVLKEKI